MTYPATPALDNARRRDGISLAHPAPTPRTQPHDDDLESQGGEVIPLARPLPNLHPEFWNQRRSLAHIRDAAHSACASPDLVLHALLARLASMLHHETRVDTGIGQAVMNYSTIVVGPSGAGKSTGVAIARDLLPNPDWLGGDAYRDGVPLGSGEGLAEMFMGTVDEETDQLIKNGPRRGEYRTKPVRKQCRHNAFVYVDEGESLIRTIERAGSTIGPALRSAWAGETLGQANASQDTTRIIQRGAYSLGLVIGFQPGTIAPLFSDAAGGTPQRFMFASATDPHIPDDVVAWPGSLAISDPARARRIPVADPEVLHSIRAERLARQRGDCADEDQLDAHRPLHLAKTAALLALLDDRDEIDGLDWRLAEAIWRLSTRVRDDLIRRDQAEAQRRVAAARDEYASREAQAEAARRGVPANIERVARNLAGKVHEKQGVRRTELRRTLRSTDRQLFDAAVAHAESQGWAAADGEDLVPGGAVPV